MIMLQFRIAIAADGTVKIEMDRLEREDATPDERELVSAIHDLNMAALQEMINDVKHLTGADVSMDIIEKPPQEASNGSEESPT